MARHSLSRALVAAVGATLAAAAPCDLLAAAGAPCVAAHSVARALYATYSGTLYVVRRASDNHTFAVGALAPGGFADSAAQDAFCAGSDCVVWRVVDQSPFANDLQIAPPGGNGPHFDKPCNASRLPVTIGGGHKVYGLYFEGGMGYRIDATNGVAVGNAPEVIYMVTSGTHYNDGCCFDYGNAESNNDDTGSGSMEAVYFGTWNATADGWCGGAGPGPWIMSDLENGLWACGNSSAINPLSVPFPQPFVTAMVKGGENGFALKGGDATQGTLSTLYDGPRPTGYQR